MINATDHCHTFIVFVLASHYSNPENVIVICSVVFAWSCSKTHGSQNHVNIMKVKIHGRRSDWTYNESFLLQKRNASWLSSLWDIKFYITHHAAGATHGTGSCSFKSFHPLIIFTYTEQVPLGSLPSSFSSRTKRNDLRPSCPWRAGARPWALTPG